MFDIVLIESSINRSQDNIFLDRKTINYIF